MSAKLFPIIDGAAAPVGKRFALTRLWREDPSETALFCALVIGLAFVPFWLGSDRPLAWGINGVWFPTLALLYELLVLLTGRRHPVALKRIAAPAGLFCLALIWIVAQMSPSVGPSLAHPIWGMTADVLERPINGSISVNRGETAIALLRLLTAASAFWLALQLSRHPLRAHLLLQAISVIIAAYSAYGLILTAFFDTAIPLFDVPEWGGGVRATFVNHNNFATYAGLGLIVTVALTLRLFRHEVPDQAGVASYRLIKFIQAMGERGWFLLGAGFVILVALLGTGSRGGILATALGLLALFVLSFSRQRRRRTQQIEAILFVAIALVAGFAFFGDLIAGRIASAGLADAGRLSAYVIAIRSILDTPLLGFGYGTFEDVFRMYRDQSIGTFEIWDRAHNTYLEVWQGLGLVFGSALIGAVFWLVVKCFRGALKRRRDATPAIVAAAVSLLVGVHALVDFSAQMEAIALTFMVILGAGVAQSDSSKRTISD